MNPFDIIDAKEYDGWYDKRADLYLKELSCLSKLKRGKSCLDVGGGTGRFSDWLTVDLSLNMLKVARSKGLESINASCEALPFRDQSFPCAIAVTLFCFVKDPNLCLREMLRVASEVVICIIEKGSKLAKTYEEKGKRGHIIFSKAEFLPLSFFLSRLHIHDICEPIEGFICFRGSKGGRHGNSRPSS